MSEQFVRTIQTDETGLNQLFKEVLDGLRDDLLEAQTNVDMYGTLIKDHDAGVELFGQLYNSALTIKGSARDRQLKFLNSFKERVSKKESMDQAKEMKEKETKGGSGGFDHIAMNEMLEKLRQNGTLNQKTENDKSGD